ncbi:MAG: Cys-tRNA(Pro) deacylase [Anaerovoracaceae bacterium]|jgi:Cys-tRNA(Pro)/Cys-tRNA(Cys) deacylase
MKKKEEKTNAVRILEQQGLSFETHNYADSGAVSGVEVAAALGQDPGRLYKTLVTVGKSGTHYVFLVPASGELEPKKAARAVGEKSIQMVKGKELLPLTGYVHGGCSPVGMKKQFQTIIDQSGQAHSSIFISGGKIGHQIQISLDELAKAVPFRLADISQPAE